MSEPTFYLPRLIGLSGLAGTGKDTAAAHLCNRHCYVPLSFAEPIRWMVQSLLEYVGQPSSWMTDRALKEQPIPGLGHSSREMQQELGTAFGRERMGQHFWVELLAYRMTRCPGERFVITDVRFPNEAEFIRSVDGAIWQLQRDLAAPVRAHVSEQAMATIRPTLVLFNNGTVEDLHQQIDELLAVPMREVRA